MFANVARRTQNLVQRQLAVVDELERNEQDPTLLERLYRLDHLSARLRRSADKLLVISGSREPSMTTKPIELATALRSALAEIEDYKRVRIGALCDVTLTASVASDLVLVFAELLENATASSPPDSVIELSAKIRSDGSCLVLIVDHGVGMTPEQLAEENQRLVERERLDIAPTGVLGLFVVGRLARRHSLDVELVETPGGGITALVTIPPELLLRQTPARVRPIPAQDRPLRRRPHHRPFRRRHSACPVNPDDGFVWFDPDAPAAAPARALRRYRAPVLAARLRRAPNAGRRSIFDQALEDDAPPLVGSRAQPPPTSDGTSADAAGEGSASPRARRAASGDRSACRPDRMQRRATAARRCRRARRRWTTISRPSPTRPALAGERRDGHGRGTFCRRRRARAAWPATERERRAGASAAGSRADLPARSWSPSGAGDGGDRGTGARGAGRRRRPPGVRRLRGRTGSRQRIGEPWQIGAPWRTTAIAVTQRRRAQVTSSALGVTAQASNFNWLVNRFAQDTAGVIAAIAVSSDGLLIAMSSGVEGADAERLGAISSAMLSLANGVGECHPIGSPTRSSSS